MSKQMTEKKEQLPTTIDFGADAGGGMEGTDKDSFAIPFLRVLQKISPQVDEGDAAYIEGAKGGMFLNTVTGQLFDGKEGVVFLPCAFQRRFLRWAPRGSDQGYKGEYLPEDVAAMRESGEVRELEGRLYFPTDDGEVSEKRSDRLIDTRSHFGMTEDGVQFVMPLASTQIKKSKQLMSMLSAKKINGVTPPTWMNKIRATSVLESNDQGSWYGVKFEPVGELTDPALYAAARDFHGLISSGAAKAKFEEDAEADDGKF
jgi:hypothetical protein